MSTQQQQSLLQCVSQFSIRWFKEVVEPDRFSMPLQASPRSRDKTRRGDSDYFGRKLSQCIVSDVAKAFDLERCGLLLPVQHKKNLWKLAAHVGFPKQIASRKTYRKGLGLSGRVLAGETLRSTNILGDHRRSGYHGSAWISEHVNAEPSSTPRAFLGVPLWTQIADLHRRTSGALIAIRPSPFSDYEESTLTIVSELVSHAFGALAVYDSRLQTDQRNVELHRMWALDIPIDHKLEMTLRFLQEVMPFKRMLISLVNDARTHIEGRAVLGFRRGLIHDTRRKLFAQPPADIATEDILATFVREKKCHPEIISRDDAHVHVITALRHQVENDLLLLPLVDANNQCQGVILAELPDTVDSSTTMPLSIGELERFSLHATQIADYVSKNRSRVSTDIRLSLWSRISVTLNECQFDTHTVSRLLRTLCDGRSLERAAIMGFDKASHSLRCEASCNCGDTTTYQKQVQWATNDSLTLAERAILTGQPSFGTVGEAFPFLSKRHRPAEALPQTREELTCVAIPFGSQEPCLGALVAAFYENSDIEGTVANLLLVSGVIAQSLDLRNAWLQWDQLRRKADAQHSFAYRVSVLGALDREIPLTIHAIVDKHRKAFESLLQDVSEALGSHLTELFVPESPVKLDCDGQIPSSDVETKFTQLVLHVCGGSATPREDRRDVTKDSTHGGLTASVLQTMTRQMSVNVPDDEVWSGATREFTPRQVRTWLGVPMIATIDDVKYCWGVLSSTRARKSDVDSLSFGEDDLNVAQSFADRLAALFCQMHQVRSFRDRTQSFLQRFDHDLPNLADHVENLSESFVKASGEQRDEIGRKLTSSAGALKACVTSLLAAFYEPSDTRGRLWKVSVERIANRLKEMITLCSISYGVDFAVINNMGSSCECVSDEDALLYVLYVLLHNGFRSCSERRRRGDIPVDGFKVHVEFLEATRSGGESVARVIVRDNGCGFDKRIPDPSVIHEGQSFWGRKGLGMGRVIVSSLLSRIGASEFASRNRADGEGAEVGFCMACVGRQ